MNYRKMSLLTASLLAMGVATAGSAQAEGEVTFVSQGGSYQDAQRVAILNPVAEELGITINEDSAPDAWPQIKTQGQTGATWDVVDTPTSNCLRGGQQGLIEKLDFDRMPNAKAMPEEYRTDYSVAYEFYSSVLAYDPEEYPNDPPNSWEDFWNVEKYPGDRALRDHPLATLEAALMADGVPRDELYPMDVDRAFAKLEEIKPHIDVWWTSGGQSAQLLHDGEVDMIMMWNGRVSALQDEGASAAYTYNDGILQNTQLCILKDAPNLDTAYEFINAAVSPEYQANLPLEIDYGPGNPAAFDTGKISDARKAELPSAPENAAKQVLMSYEWWTSEEGEKAERRWLSFMQN